MTLKAYVHTRATQYTPKREEVLLYSFSFFFKALVTLPALLLFLPSGGVDDDARIDSVLSRRIAKRKEEGEREREKET